MERITHTPRSYEPETIIAPVVCTILGNTTPANGTFTIVEGAKAVGTLARTGVGAYSLRLTDKFPKCIGAQVSIFPHNLAARGVKMGAIDTTSQTASSRTVAFNIVNTAEAAVDTPNGETDRVYLTLFLKNSTAK